MHIAAADARIIMTDMTFAAMCPMRVFKGGRDSPSDISIRKADVASLDMSVDVKALCGLAGKRLLSISCTSL